MRPPLLSPAERRARPQLEQIASKNDWFVWPHVKLSDIVDKRPDGVDRTTWEYAKKAHFDFVVLDEQTRPMFAVEIDGPSHKMESAQRHDRMKDQLVEASQFEMLRISSTHLNKGPRGRCLLDYIIDARQYLEAAWASDYASTDPYFDPNYKHIVEWNADGGITLANDLAEPARLRAFALRSAGKIASGFITTIHVGWKDGWSEGWAWVQIAPDLWLLERSKVRAYGSFRCGIPPFELARDLAAHALGDGLKRLEDGDDRGLTSSQMQQEVNQTLRSRKLLTSTYHLDRCRFL